MGLAYCILAHKNPAQIARLLKAIAHPDNVFVLHYEKSAPRSEHAELARLAEEMPNLHLLPSRRVLWGRFTQIGVQLEGIERCLELSGKWSHFITLTGQDFPLLPQAAMVEELSGVAAMSYLSYFDPFAAAIWKNVEDRTGLIHLDSAPLEALLRVPFFGRRIRWICGWSRCMPSVPFVRRKLPAWFRYMGGANHVVLSREAASYVVNDPNAGNIIRWLKYSGHPDESIFQSVLVNSPLAGSIVNDDRRAIYWGEVGSPSPMTLTCAQLPWLREAKAAGKLFARKFDAGVDNEVIRELEKDLGL